MKLTSFVFLYLFISTKISAQTLTVYINGLRNNSGSVRLQFFDTKENFDREHALFTKTATKTTATRGTLSITYTGIKAGTYGIAILDDENNNQKMDYGLLLPKEGFGFSDYYHSGMSRPDFKKFCFTFGAGGKSVYIKLRYL